MSEKKGLQPTSWFEQNGIDKSMILERLQEGFIGGVPHNAALGLRMVDIAQGVVVIALPYDAKLVGNPATGVIHGGAITATMDAACGGSVMMALMKPTRVATIDLRIDYLGPAKPGYDVHCRAECYKVTRTVAFVRATAFQPETPDGRVDVASAAGTFMIFRDDARSATAKAKAGT
jgi:uncharacterized protein (TIGR00369 family)